MADLFSLRGKVSLITGARSGIGRAAAEALAAAGSDIIGAGSQPMPATRAAIEALGRRCQTIQVDLAERGAPQRLAEIAIRQFGRIDVLVNSAGLIRRSSAIEHSEQDWDRVIDVNQRAPFFVSQAVARHMIERGIEGRIINIASVLSFQGGLNVAAYTASKHAIAGITRAMANELGPHGITVNAIAPGYTITDNTDPLRADAQRAQEIVRRIPAGRWGVPEDMKTAVLFLASPASSFVTGIVLPVDGGWLSR